MTVEETQPAAELTKGSAADRLLSRVRQQVLDRVPLDRLRQPAEAELRSTWRQAGVARIEESLRLSQLADPGGWYVIGESGDVGRGRSLVRTVAGREIVLWRGDDGRLLAGPGACPHMGARLHDCVVAGDRLFCRWHGMALGPGGETRWSALAALDDGVLLWVRIPTPGEELTDAPVTTRRPPAAESVAAVINQRALCEPADVIANRLDPWHGAWFHPYAFSHLSVDESASDPHRLVVDVTFRLNRSWGISVRADFTCPDARTIVMTIIDGQGAGSVVETHATPLGYDERGYPATMITEATTAYSDAREFAGVRRFGPLLRPLMRRTARRLWVDDLAYAERRYALRHDRA